MSGGPPPHDPVAEDALVGALMVLGNDRAPAVEEIANGLPAVDFYVGSRRYMWEAIADLVLAGSPSDSASVAIRLREVGRLEQVGGMAALAALLNAHGCSLRAIEGYARTIRDLAARRRFIAATRYALAQAEEGTGDTGALIAETEEKIHQLGQGERASTTTTMREAVKGAFRKLREHAERGGGIHGVSTGFAELDEALGGLHPGDVTVVAARPAMGKSACVMAIAGNIAMGGKGAAVWSLEMPSEQLAMRALASEGRVNLGDIRRGQLSPLDLTKLTHAATSLCKNPHFYLDDKGGSTLADIRTKARKIQRTMAAAGVTMGLVAVDYLQLVEGQRESREQSISEVSRGLKSLAKELGVPVIALSQLNRSCESRNDKRPMLSDLRESGAIEQDADNVLFLYRDDYYNPKSEKPGVCEVIIAKQRNGPTGVVDLAFDARTATFRSPMAEGHGVGGPS